MYLYYCGHQPELSKNEFAILTGDKNFEYTKNWVISEEKIDVNKASSLVFGLKILTETEFSSNSNIAQELDKYLQTANLDLPKKLGFCNLLEKNDSNLWIDLVKKNGAKKINFLHKIPTVGNFKSTKAWLFVIRLDNKIVLAQLESFFDQEFWAKLDINLPHKNLKIGIINLKLAKFLANLTQNNYVWDPFCGFGRNLIATIDTKEFFLASDQNPECVNLASKNFEFSKKYFQLENPESIHSKFFVADGLDMDLIKQETENIELSKYSILTEGTLGTSFLQRPDLRNAEVGFEKVITLWQEFLSNCAAETISEIVFCLPFYEVLEKDYILNQLSLLTSQNNYRFVEFLEKKQFLIYRRKDAFVGHLIVKLVL